MTSKEESAIFELSSKMKIPITFADPDMSDRPLVFANQHFEALTGYASSNVIGKNCRFLQGNDTDRAEIDKIRSAVEQCLPSVSAILNYKANGDAFHNMLIIRPIWLANGRCLLMGCQYEFDFTTRRKEVELNFYNRFEAAERIQAQLRTIEMKAKETLLMRSDAAASKIKNYVIRQKAHHNT